MLVRELSARKNTPIMAKVQQVEQFQTQTSHKKRGDTSRKLYTLPGTNDMEDSLFGIRNMAFQGAYAIRFPCYRGLFFAPKRGDGWVQHSFPEVGPGS